MMHPKVRDVNMQLFTEEEKKVLVLAIEIMITFDIKMKEVSGDGELEIAKFEPNIATLVCFGQKSRSFMKVKT
jgi:hypothetical protein